MVLEFRPPYEPDRNRDRQSLQNLTQTIGGIGDDWQKYGQQQQQNKVRQAMLDLQKQKETRDQGMYNYEYGDPMASGGYGGGTPDAAAPSPSAWGSQGTMGPQPQTPPEQPNFSMQTGQDAYASQGPASQPQPIDHTSHFNTWKSMGMPSMYDHADYGGTGKGSDPLSRYSQVMNMPGAKRRGEALNMFKESDAHDLQQAQMDELRAKAEMMRSGGPSGNKGTWHQDPFTGEYKFYPTVMPRNTPAGTPTNNSGGGTTSSPPPAHIPFRDRSKMESESREMDAIVGGAIQDITQAISLNKNSYGGKFGGMIMKGKSALNMGQNDEQFKNTATVVNSLKSQVSKVLKSTFGGQLSDSERQYLNEVYGAAEGMSQTEREIAMNNVIKMLQQKAQAAQSKAGMGNQPSSSNAQTVNNQPPQMRVINGKRYEKHGDQWYEASN